MIRRITERDWPTVWAILEPVFRAGETYAVNPRISEQEARHYWTALPAQTWVAEDDVSGEVVGTYYLKTNQPGPGSHVCNCGYVVGDRARGQGVASALCEHSQAAAIDLGYRAMQYNCVAASNTGAVRLWLKLGYTIAGTLPGAFHHPVLGEVDAYVMFKRLIA